MKGMSEWGEPRPLSACTCLPKQSRAAPWPSACGRQAGTIGRTLLLVGAIAGMVGWAVLVVDWDAIGGIVILLFASLAVFRGVALKAKPFARWNGLPLIAGIAPLTTLLVVPDRFELVFIAIFGVSLVLLGYMLQARWQEQSAFTS